MDTHYLKGTIMQHNKPIDLLGFGNTIVDIEYRVDEAMLNTLGIAKGSMTLINANQKQNLMDQLPQAVHKCSGGSVANSLYAASLFGLSTYHIGVIGNDDLAEFSKNDYNSNNIQHSFEELGVNGDSGCCLVLITPDGERTMLTYLGVSSSFQLNDHFYAIIPQAKVLFIEGYLLADDNVFDLLKNTIIPIAKNNDTKIAFTLSDAGLVGFFKDRFREFLALKCDLIFANLTEAKNISTLDSISDMHSFFDSIANEVIITDGQDGAYTLLNNQLTHHTTAALKAVDTTGAGDSFAGTYIAQRLQNKSIEESCTLANQAAGIVISNYGARPIAFSNEFSNA